MLVIGHPEDVELTHEVLFILQEQYWELDLHAVFFFIVVGSRVISSIASAGRTSIRDAVPPAPLV